MTALSDLCRVLSRWPGPWAMICLFWQVWRRTPLWVLAVSTPSLHSVRHQQQQNIVFTVFQVLYPRWSSNGGQPDLYPKRIWLKVCCWLCVPCSPWRAGGGEGVSEPAAVNIEQLKLSVWRENWQLFASTVCVRNMAWRLAKGLAAPAYWLCCYDWSIMQISISYIQHWVCFCAVHTHM